MTKRPSPSRAEPAERDGLDRALRALKHRERSVAQVDRFLAERGIAEGERVDVLETLVRTSLVNDRRFAEMRAASLAERGAGDTFIRFELARAGVDGDVVNDVVAGIPTELERAEQVVARRGASPKTARYLASKGFSEDVVRTAVAPSQDESLG